MPLCGCAAEEEAPPEKSEADTEQTININGTEFTYRLNYINENMITASFSSPPSVKGMVLRCSNGSYSISLDTLLCKLRGAPPLSIFVA